MTEDQKKEDSYNKFDKLPLPPNLELDLLNKWYTPP
jgi:hypothetical protein